MVSLFVDTNVFLRFLTNVDPAKAKRAETLFRDALRGKIRLATSLLVIAEIIWTLESFYKLEKSDIAAKVEKILNTPNLDCPEAPLLFMALDLYVLVFCFTTSAWSADVLKDGLINLFGAAGEYIGAGYKLSYVDQTECRKYLFKKDTANAFTVSKNDVGKMIHDNMFNDLLKAIEPMQSQLRKEIDVLIGSEPTAFQCGKAKGIASKYFEQSQNNWLRAVKSFNRAKQDQGLTR